MLVFYYKDQKIKVISILRSKVYNVKAISMSNKKKSIFWLL